MRSAAATAATAAKAATAKELRRLRREGMLHGVPRIGPQTVHIDIANACNTRCVTCWHHSPLLRPEQRPAPGWVQQRLALSTFLTLLDELAGLGGLEELIISGMGEPFLNPDVYAMVAAALERRLGVTVITNLLTADVPRLLSRVPPGGRLELLVSVCGADEPSWQAFHRHPRPDGFARLLAGLALLRRAGLRPRHVQVIQAENYRLLPQMVRFAASQGAVAVRFKLASLGGGNEVLALRPEQQRELLAETVPAALRLAEELGVATDLPAFASQVQDDPLRTAPIEQVGCFMGHLYARVTVEQELLFCCSTEVSVGRLDAGHGFAALWHGARHQALRDALRAGRFFPGCARCGKYKQNLKWAQRLREGLPPGLARQTGLQQGAPSGHRHLSPGPPEHG